MKRGVLLCRQGTPIDGPHANGSGARGHMLRHFAGLPCDCHARVAKAAIGVTQDRRRSGLARHTARHHAEWAHECHVWVMRRRAFLPSSGTRTVIFSQGFGPARMRSLPCDSRGGLGWGCLCFSVQPNVDMTSEQQTHDDTLGSCRSLRSHPTLALPYCRRGGDAFWQECDMCESHVGQRHPHHQTQNTPAPP